MKKLSELKISPTPWRKAVNNFGMGENIIWDSNCHLVQYSGLNPLLPYEMHQANHSMIVASPEMYEALFDIVAYCESNHLVPSEKFAPILEKSKAVLAEAAGESEVK